MTETHDPPRPTGRASVDAATAEESRRSAKQRRTWYCLARLAWLSGRDAPKLRSH